MAKYKYQLGTFNLFDYAGVERHLEKMAAKGWQFDSVNTFWKFKKAESEKLKYSVTYIPEASDLDPEPLEKQKEIEKKLNNEEYIINYKIVNTNIKENELELNVFFTVYEDITEYKIVEDISND